MLTLDLDPRYRLIALAIALYTYGDTEDIEEKAFSVSWVREEALTWWPQGFRTGAGEDIVRALLDEMVGLGVLRQVSTGRYALRNPNIISLMGNQKRIESELEELSNAEPPSEYEAASFRSALYDNPALRSPMTAQQESELRTRRSGVSIVFGCPAAGLDHLQVFLSKAFGDEFLISLKAFQRKEGFSVWLTDLKKRRRDGVTLALIPHNCDWESEWVDEAISLTSKLTSRTSFVRVLFVADPHRSWHLLAEDGPILEELEGKGVTVFSLRPWDESAVKLWLDDCGFGHSDRDNRQLLESTTGYWSSILEEFFSSCKASAGSWLDCLVALDSKLREPNSYEELAREFGLDVSTPTTILRALTRSADPQSIISEDLSDKFDPEMVNKSLIWADLLSLLSPTGSVTGELQPVVDYLLKADRG